MSRKLVSVRIVLIFWFGRLLRSHLCGSLVGLTGVVCGTVVGVTGEVWITHVPRIHWFSGQRIMRARASSRQCYRYTSME